MNHLYMLCGDSVKSFFTCIKRKIRRETNDCVFLAKPLDGVKTQNTVHKACARWVNESKCNAFSKTALLGHGRR